jgi:hypothetical protein
MAPRKSAQFLLFPWRPGWVYYFGKRNTMRLKACFDGSPCFKPCLSEAKVPSASRTGLMKQYLNWAPLPNGSSPEILSFKYCPDADILGSKNFADVGIKDISHFHEKLSFYCCCGVNLRNFLLIKVRIAGYFLFNSE